MTTKEQTNLRIPAALKEWLQAQADANRRSLTGEVVARLEETQRRQQAATGKAKS